MYIKSSKYYIKYINLIVSISCVNMEDMKDYITRRQIINLLKTRGEMAVKELSSLIGITPMGVRGHLLKMESEGFVQSVSKRVKRGRPTFYYRLGQEANKFFPSTEGQIAIELLSCLTPEEITRLFQQRQRLLKKAYDARLANKSFYEKMAELGKIRDAEGYMCETSGETKLVEHHCPISRMAGSFPQACEFELNLFKSVLGADVKRVKHIMAGDSCCSYVIKKT